MLGRAECSCNIRKGSGVGEGLEATSRQIVGSIEFSSMIAKHTATHVPGECEVNHIANRRPELYGVTTEPSQ